MKALAGISLIWALSACAGSDRYTLAAQCAHEPGCASTLGAHDFGPQQARVIKPQTAGQWEPLFRSSAKRDRHQAGH